MVHLNGQSNKYHIIVLSEIWIKSGVEDRYQISGYDMLMQPRLENQAGGMDLRVQATWLLLSANGPSYCRDSAHRSPVLLYSGL
ncbi:hypothetical protein J6590_090419 [Homalodisca vitripennis]|nr:hypothetical protein J6590_090419 [Homalodisca vitripennis]